MCYLEDEDFKDFISDELLRESKGVSLEFTRLGP